MSAHLRVRTTTDLILALWRSRRAILVTTIVAGVVTDLTRNFYLNFHLQ